MRQWYETAAAQGNAHGQLLHGILSVQGKGDSHDYKKALVWIRLAADQGLHDAQHFLGLKYENGKGVSQNFIQAHKLYILAGVNGLEIADTDRDAIKKQMTPAQIAEAQQLAREWKPKGQ